jgi:HK97 family phage prohead protease
MNHRAKTDQLEQRAFKGLEVREAPEKSGLIGVLTGYAARFNSDSVEFPGYDKPWIERIAPGAFKRTLTDQPDVYALVQHDSSRAIGRTPGTLKLFEDENGLRAEIGLKDTTLGRDLLEQVRAGIIDAMSFGFKTRAQKWEEGEKRDLRTLLDVELFEVSAVIWPAYPETSIAVRSHEEWRKLQPVHSPETDSDRERRLRFLQLSSR